MRYVNAPPTREIRPPLPAGPFLVVGLARSGRAVARFLAARRIPLSTVGLLQYLTPCIRMDWLSSR